MLRRSLSSQYLIRLIMKLFADSTRNDVPAVSSLVAFRESERQGRHSVAAAPIPCGAVLAVDRPITALLNPGDPRDVFQFCLHCLRRVGRGAVVPCGRCSSVVFCSRFGESHHGQPKYSKLGSALHLTELN